MINLLPENEKLGLVWEEKQKLISILGFLMLSFLAVLSLILFAVDFQLATKIESQKIMVEMEEKRLQAAEIGKLREKISQVNENLSRLDAFYSQQLPLTEIFKRIADLLPAGVYLTNFSYQKSGSQVSLNGFSPTREALVELKIKLEAEKEFRNVTFPPTNWVKPKTINFFVTLKLEK